MLRILANVVVDYFLEGGPIMWPILVALVAAIAVVLERSLWWWGLWRRTRSARLQKASTPSPPATSTAP